MHGDLFRFSARRMSVLAAVLAVLTFAPRGMADVQVLGTQFRADRSFPQYRCFWHEDSNIPDEPEATGGEEATAAEPLGASLHVLLLNAGSSPLTVQDVDFAGESLTKVLAISEQRKERNPASIYFANLPEERLNALIAAGEPIWFKVDPQTIAPGGTGQVVVRIRQIPQVKSLKLDIKHGAGSTAVEVPVQPRQPRLAGAYFSQPLQEVYLYFRHPDKGKAPTKILLDGQDVTASATIASDAGVDLAPVVLHLKQALAPGSFHVLQGVYDDGQTASAGLRAWCDDFAYGIWGSAPSQEEDKALAHRYLTDITDHNINTQVQTLASKAVMSFLNTDQGRQFVAAHALHFVIDEPGKWGVKNPFLFFLRDEPDCADYKMQGPPESKKVGLLAQWCVKRGYELRAVDDKVLNLVNLDMTYKPHNWYVYGQVPDVMCVDPYYQARLRAAVLNHPERMKIYSKATYVYAVAAVAESACEPNPLHVILYSCNWINSKTGKSFPFPTPESKRIEVYYALAGGAKGLSYWWYIPNLKGSGKKGTAANGVGAGPLHGDPAANALWRQIGLLGAEVRTAGPVLLRSCPAAMEVQATKGLWTRALLAGTDAIVLLVVNDEYANSEKGIKYKPIENASLAFELPSWLKSPDAFEINAAGIRPIARTAGRRMVVDLGTVDLTRMIVVTSDAKLRDRLQELYDAKFKANVARLERPATPTAQKAKPGSGER